MVGKKGKSKTGRMIFVAVLTVVVIAAVLVYFYRDELFPSDNSGNGVSEPYTYEYGANQQFALMDGQLAIASSTGLQLLDKNGYTLFRQVFSMKNPAVSANGEYCVFYDVGGTELRLYSGGNILEIVPDGSIISVSLCSSGYIAVSCETPGYKGEVTVYNSKGTPVYKWSSGTGYVLDAALSPDGSRLAVLCLEGSGSVIHLFELKKDDEAGTVYISGDLAFKVSFTGNSSFCALSESALRFYSTVGEELSSTKFGDLTLMDFLLSEKNCVISLSKYVTGSDAALTGFSADGKALGTAELNYSPLALVANRQNLLVLVSGKAIVLSQDMSVLSETEIPAGYNTAVYLPSGDCLLLSSYHGEKIPLK